MVKRKRDSQEKPSRASSENDGAIAAHQKAPAVGVQRKGRGRGGEGDGDAGAEISAEAAELTRTDEFVSDGSYKNKQRVLVLASRGITARYRHLLEDLRRLLPHHKRDVKFDAKDDIHVINEIAEMKGCSTCLFLDCRKKRDLYLWLGKTPHGPSAKFHVVNTHTMDELKLTGNCMMGSRPLLNFDLAFEETAHFRLLKRMLSDAFGAPRGHPKTKPFIDHVISFAIADGNIWLRNYQIQIHDKSSAATKGSDTALIEIGPRLVLIPIRIFVGSFGGPTLFQNTAYISPNQQRSDEKRSKGLKYSTRIEQTQAKRQRKEEAVLPPHPVDDVFKANL